MADLQLAVTYKTRLSRHGATMMWALWPVWALLAPLCVLATIAAISISPIIFSPAVTLSLLSVSTLVFVSGILLTAVFEDNRIALDHDRLSFPLAIAPFLGLRKQLNWSELCQADLARITASTEPESLTLSFSSVATIRLQLRYFSKLELEQLLMAIELWGRRCVWSEDLLEFQRQVQNENKGIEKVSYTQLWEDELNRRFRNTIFVPLEPGSTLQSGSLVILRQLAFGGLSAIYLARRNGKEFVVIKEANPSPDAELAAKQKAAQLFQREAQLLMKLNHERIARVLDHFIENSRSYLLLEYIKGQDLRQYIREHGPQNQETVLRWAFQIASVLDYLHNQPQPIIHRDLSPDNLMLQADGSLVLIDFGAANEFISQATGTVVGKQAYMPPEQLRGKATIKSDYYALGASIYFLLTGEDPPAISVLHPSEKAKIAGELDDLVASLTALDLNDRLNCESGSLAPALAKLGGAGLQKESWQ